MLRLLVRHIIKHMANKARAYGRNAVWMHNKPPEIIWYLKQFEVAEFHDMTLS